MKKLLFLLSFVSTLALTGCNNDNTVNPKTELGKATIKGNVFAELNNTSPGLEKAPSVPIWARISTKDLVLNPIDGNTYPDKYYQTTTDANGAYSIDVDTNPDKDGMTVTILPQDFVATVQVDATTTKSVQFSGATKSTTVNVYNVNGTFYATDIKY